MANIRRTEGREIGPLAGQSGAWDPFRVFRDLMRWDPFRDLEPLLPTEKTFVPAFDVRETGDAYVFEADLPGVREEDVEISLTGNRLTVRGRRESERREQEDQYFAAERSYGSFVRSFTLPEGSDPDQVRAEFKNGVLGLTVPKKPEVQPRRITIAPGQPHAGDGGKSKHKV